VGHPAPLGASSAESNDYLDSGDLVLDHGSDCTDRTDGTDGTDGTKGCTGTDGEHGPDGAEGSGRVDSSAVLATASSGKPRA
jgi:hypothetical protein